MVTDSRAPITHWGFIARDELSDDVDVVGEVSALNAAGVDVGWMWELGETRPDPETEEEGPTLAFGVHNAVGFLQWHDGADVLVPTTGTNADWVEYRSAGLHPALIRPHAEVPVELVLAAVVEYLDTGQRPTCVEWEPGASLRSRS
ncbi:immunity protein Imm1 of predicted polymorphic toxin system [Actinokineospora cianjurensis]|uniref:Immunity protein Imm1 of predicted polymorphic toxin system n=1 Tax=Actinokineospora cianjurensis TaxID=585224 RepID=A0A421BAU1_9PSEU|nr:immunity protein Imm1 of predicted polymorphic toxin system [Actinokineospora cianjurensis]